MKCRRSSTLAGRASERGRVSPAPSLALRAGVSALAALLFVAICRGDDQSEKRRGQLLAQMRSLAEQTKVQFAKGERQAELVKDPVFRYDDQPRRFIDATMWAWTDNGRPVAFQKVEAMEFGDKSAPNPWWQYCFASLSTELLSVEWPEGRSFRSSEPGVTFAPLAESPALAAGNPQRKRQARELARKFSARIVTVNTTQEMRLLTTPLFEYSDAKTKEFRGAVFGLSTNGTNPDVLLVLEVRGEQEKAAWHFAAARMTTGGVTLKYRDAKVWECESFDRQELPRTTWTHFVTRRQPAGDEGEKKP